MLNIFKRNKKEENNIKENPNYFIRIEFKNGKILGYEIESNEFPNSYRKIINWFFARKSQKYIFTYRNGSVVLDRDDLLIIQTTKETK